MGSQAKGEAENVEVALPVDAEQLAVLRADWAVSEGVFDVQFYHEGYDVQLERELSGR